MTKLRTPKRRTANNSAAHDQWSDVQLRAVVESVAEHAIFATDSDGRISLWSGASEQVFGYRAEEIKGEHIGILFTPEDRAIGADLEELRRAAASGRAFDERYHLRKDGTRFYCSGVTSPIRTASGEVTGYVKVARDLTRERKQAQALVDARNELEARVAERTGELVASRAGLARELEERIVAERRIRNLLARMITLQEEERRRIARDLHDNIGQQMTALHLRLAALAKQIPGESGPVVDKLRDVQTAVQQLERELDFFTWELRPGALYNLGLVHALTDFAAVFSDQYQLPVHFDCLGIPDARLPPEAEINLYRIVQECLNNVYKHARATRVEVLLQKVDERVVLTVSDDGVGFDADSPNSGRLDGGLGLQGMRERAAMIGGTLDIESAPGEGTSVIITAPAKFTERTEGSALLPGSRER